jgi:hypothetical protein
MTPFKLTEYACKGVSCTALMLPFWQVLVPLDHKGIHLHNFSGIGKVCSSLTNLFFYMLSVHTYKHIIYLSHKIVLLPEIKVEHIKKNLRKN